MFDIFVYYQRRYVNSCILTVNLNIGRYIVRSRLGGLSGRGRGGGWGYLYRELKHFSNVGSSALKFRGSEILGTKLKNHVQYRIPYSRTDRASQKPYPIPRHV